MSLEIRRTSAYKSKQKTRPGCLLAVGAFFVGENPSDSGEAKGEKASRKTPF